MHTSYKVAVMHKLGKCDKNRGFILPLDEDMKTLYAYIHRILKKQSV
jgi:hypothetical protein